MALKIVCKGKSLKYKILSLYKMYIVLFIQFLNRKSFQRENKYNTVRAFSQKSFLHNNYVPVCSASCERNVIRLFYCYYRKKQQNLDLEKKLTLSCSRVNFSIMQSWDKISNLQGTVFSISLRKLDKPCISINLSVLGIFQFWNEVRTKRRIVLS